MSRLLRTVQLALKSLLLQPLRSGLTMLGIVFGVFSVIAMLAIGEGASSQAQRQVLELGADNVIVRSVKPPAEASSGGGSRTSRVLEYGLTRNDYDLLVDSIPTVLKGIPIREMSEEARYRQKRMNVRVVGCTADYRPLNHLQMDRGKFLSDQHNREHRNVCVLATNVAGTLFGYEDPLGKAVRVGREYYTVVGVTKERTASAAVGGSLSGQDYNQDVYIPIETFRLRIGDMIIQRATGSFSREEIELNQITLRVHDPEGERDASEIVIPTAEAVRETLAQEHPGKSDYAIVVPLELLEQANQIRLVFNVVLGSIAAISLVVGGIGIMNIMLATVTERTREIGIRRALGARQRDIVAQFLTETIVLSGTGGVIGILMGLATPWAFSGIQWLVAHQIFDGGSADNEFGRLFLDMEPTIAWWSLPLAFGFSVLAGIVFGIYPARAAARLDPIEALRHE